MGYSSKISPLYKAYIEQLAKSNDVVEWASPDPNKLAYKLREALTANKDEELKAKFIIKVLPGKVRAIPRFKNLTQAEIAQNKLARMVLSDIIDLFAIIGAIIQHKTSNRELYFPNAELDDESLSKLWMWCSANGFYIVRGEGITLTTDDPGMAAWKPL